VDRAHVVMACGTGKTLVALWTAEALKPKTVLVLVPSLTLLQQTLDEWSRHNNWGRDFRYRCVCSDPTVESIDANDPIHLDATDLDFRVDTNPDVVRRFIETDRTGVKVVFSTYQSSPVLSEGVRGLAPFDIAIFDEAHKTTGQGGLFAHSLSDENIKIRKRLFFTATPRHYDIRHRDKEGDFRIISMDDEKVYGPRAYTLTFGSAARQGIICNYKVVISVVDGQEVNDFALKHGITLVEGDLIRARWVANQIAVERAIEKTAAKRAITFHSRVSSAKEFSADSAPGIKQFLPEFSVFHVNGEQKSSDRKELIDSFRDATKALITNARCLTEGIDVPAVDMVGFIDPRHSKIDIAQAAGRAMRKPRGSDKEFGYVVIPLFLERETEETLQDALSRSDFYDVANVLNAMQEEDEDLVQIIRELQIAKGKGEIFDPSRLSEKIEVVGPSIDISTLRSNIFAEVLDSIGVSWDEMFGRLLSFRARHGDCLVSESYGDGSLATWCEKNRAKKKAGTLKPERERALTEIGFDWDPRENTWQELYARLVKYREAHGDCCVPRGYEDKQLRNWVYEQRTKYASGKLSETRKEKLDAIEFVFDVREAVWLEQYQRLKSFFERHRHVDVPSSFDKSLPPWMRIQRTKYRKGRLEDSKIKMLNEVGISWDPQQDAWLEMFTKIQKMHETGEPLTVVETRWIRKQRAKYRSGKLEDDKIKQLESMGVSWAPDDDFWDAMYLKASAIKPVNGKRHTPYDHPDKRLFDWATNQRALKRKGLLAQDREKKLDAIMFDWNPADVRRNFLVIGTPLAPL
jgi:superfamily II DNA or RNA helicase